MTNSSTLLPYLIVVVLTAIPTWSLMRRTGKHRAWVLLSLVPLGTIAVLWFLAFTRWPGPAQSDAGNW